VSGYDQAAILNAQSLVILMVLPFTLLTALIFVRHEYPFVAHVAFSPHLYSFVLLLCCPLPSRQFSSRIGLS